MQYTKKWNRQKKQACIITFEHVPKHLLLEATNANNE